MEYMLITKENIDKEHICCAMSNNQALMKKEWLKKQLDEGLVFYRSVERGKCFIEYIDAENAWNPIDAPNYIFINCLWVSGSLKGHGYSNDLLNYCINDAISKNKSGICIISSKKKKGFLSDPKFLEYKGFKVCDETDNGFTLLYLPLNDTSKAPKFKDNSKTFKIEESGLVIYYSHQCPFTYYWVAREKQILNDTNISVKTILIDSKEMAQNMMVPVTNYALFKDGKYITHEILNEKKIVDIATK